MLKIDYKRLCIALIFLLFAMLFAWSTQVRPMGGDLKDFVVAVIFVAIPVGSMYALLGLSENHGKHKGLLNFPVVYWASVVLLSGATVFGLMMISWGIYVNYLKSLV